MARQDTPEYDYLKNLWNCAYNGQILDFDYTGEGLAEGRMLRFRAEIYNYRRRVRTYKLRPDMAEEWSRISQCEVIQLSSTRILVRRINKLLFGRKVSKITNPDYLSTPIGSQ